MAFANVKDYLNTFITVYKSWSGAFYYNYFHQNWLSQEIANYLQMTVGEYCQQVAQLLASFTEATCRRELKMSHRVKTLLAAHLFIPLWYHLYRPDAATLRPFLLHRCLHICVDDNDEYCFLYCFYVISQNFKSMQFMVTITRRVHQTQLSFVQDGILQPLSASHQSIYSRAMCICR